MEKDSVHNGAAANSSWRLTIVLLLVWLALLILAFSLDRKVAQWVQDHHPIDKTAKWVTAVKLMGNYWFTIFIALLLFVWNRLRLHAALALLFSGALGGLLYSLIKWGAGRHRPVVARIVQIDPSGFHPFPGGLRGLFYESGLGFPSGHACLAFASAMILTFLLPQACWLWFSLAVIVGAERVLENAHYLSDVVAGAGIGAFCGWFVWNALKPGQRFNANG